MSDPVPQQVVLKAPLCEETRKERRNLLITSTIGLAIVKTGLIPARISALGVEFSQSDQAKFRSVLIAVTIYLLSSFIVYAVSDFLSYRIETYLSGSRGITRLRESIKALDEVRDGLLSLKAVKADYAKQIQEASEQVREFVTSLDGFPQEIGELMSAETSEGYLKARALWQRFEVDSASLKEKLEALEMSPKQFDDRLAELSAKREEITLAQDMANAAEGAYQRSAYSWAWVRVSFDLVVPVLVSVYAIVALAKGR